MPTGLHRQELAAELDVEAVVHPPLGGDERRRARALEVADLQMASADPPGEATAVTAQGEVPEVAGEGELAERPPGVRGGERVEDPPAVREADDDRQDIPAPVGPDDLSRP